MPTLIYNSSDLIFFLAFKLQICTGFSESCVVRYCNIQGSLQDVTTNACNAGTFDCFSLCEQREIDHFRVPISLFFQSNSKWEIFIIVIRSTFNKNEN